ncbi:hypothetical protein Poly24_07250 [Rosistilla carotiformis]|uniref:Tetratricopeptide repeat protein n=1 Tax=Rosistilla carotiformis TaxID=2528017 RepID=A0A518JNB3_9BACT|nr:hypothetical protein [Rosistilla carotiformis]QDV67034.1 hypothetical protein Poly24_07250 [Rosistilla carotiformis]
MIHQTKMVLTGLLAIGFAVVSVPQRVSGSEPAEMYLKQLRANRYFDMALIYLDRIEKGAPAPDEIRSALDLERAQTFLEIAGTTRVPTVRDENFLKAEAALRSFVDQKKDHPRVAEARMQLGKLLLTRAVVLLEGRDLDDAKRDTARGSLDAAATVFDQIVEDLRGKLKEMQGNKIDPGDAAALALRERYRGEFLGANLLGGDVRERAGDTFPKDSPERAKRYDAALVKYKELAEKYSSLLPGAQAAFFIGRVQEKKGDADAALIAYENTMRQPDVEALRPAKTEAAARAVDILMSKSPPKLKEAIAIAAPWMGGLRPNERSLPEWQVLRTALAKAYLATASSEKPADARKTKSNARSLLVAATKVPGPHVDEARELLANIGIDVADADAAPVEAPKSFAEALAACREMMDAAKMAALPIQVLKDEIARGGENVAELKKQLDEGQADIDKRYEVASSTIQQGLAMTTPEDTQESINQGRFFLAWLESQRARYWEAAVVGEFVARRFPTDALALQCGLVALNAYQSMLQAADNTKQAALMRKIEPLALFLSEQWPDDPNSASAANLLVQISMLDKRWDDVEKYLVKIPSESPSRAKFQNLLGQFLWNEYQQQTKDEQTEQAAATLRRSIEQLDAGLKLVQRDDVDNTTLLSALLLSKAKLQNDDAKAALSILENETYGPLVRMKGEGALKSPGQGFVPDTYRTALQAVVSQLKDGGDGSELLPKAKGMMSDLRTALESEPDANKKLIGIYYSLAKDIRQQIEQAKPNEKAKLIDAVKLFLGNVGEQSSDPATIHWVAQTFIEMGESAMGDVPPPATGQAKDLLEAAAKQLQALIDTPSEDPDAVRQIRFELATTSRMMGDYKEAINQLEQILIEKNSMIDAQIQAALSYQQWALSPGFNPKYVKNALNSAMSGARPDATKKNTIWGWGKLAKLAQGKPAFEATFFDARYRIAECLYLTGQRSPNPSDKSTYGEKAEKVILGTLQLYPKLGGPEDVQRNDQLIRQAQQAQSKSPTGLPK